MAKAFATGRYAWAVCDVCGFRVKLNTLQENIMHGRRTGIMACKSCSDPDHEQNWLPDVVAAHGPDPQALKNPRPEPNTDRVLSTANPNWLEQLQNGVA